MARRIDAHHHLWRYTPEEYGWIGTGMEVLQRDFLVDDLAREMAAASVDGAIVVQARQTLEETRWLLECSSATAAIEGVVGWVPLADENLPAILRELRGEEQLKGVRHVVQDEPAGFLLGAAFNAGIETVLDAGLTYDLLIREEQLREAFEFARRHPQLSIVLDHMAKPGIAVGTREPWRSDLMRLAECPNVWCKVSGLVTEADWRHWQLADLRPYLDCALAAFGVDRLLAGSDWPVCLVATGYERWWSTLVEWSGGCMEAASQEKFLGENARMFYGLDEPADEASTL